ncbi:nitric oxide reductase activation protein NorD [Parasedimentitalea huanghaiensis]|uniref:VWA domain-containing protein n=1 Tax=Parasedimentitalea huanghaiensis TaxID=2682100 RepID=A0A6L6WGS4_9RHOB|nr:VWA domain-containing protein [Zongyanglinia huanghaiensis]MVO16670.1 VWA domain-containing protein [Zongyanglinia huanghaiensis]
MDLSPLDLMEPEETVGNLWHDYASGIGAAPSFPGAAVNLAQVRPSLAVLFRALDGAPGVELGDAPDLPVTHRRAARHKLGTGGDTVAQATFDGERLRLPPVMDLFPQFALNRAAYFWLAALAAKTDMSHIYLPDPKISQQDFDRAQIHANVLAAARAFATCPGLREAYASLCRHTLQMRPRLRLPTAEADIERLVSNQLSGQAGDQELSQEARGYLPFAPVPIWLRFLQPGAGDTAQADPDEAAPPPPAAGVTKRKLGFRRDLDQANRKDSFIIHRFESILSWVESMNLNRSVDDDDDEHAQKAADDQDNITLTKNDRRAATRLRLHLDLSPADAEHEKLSGEFIYPEWNHRARSYMDGHCRVLEADAKQDPEAEEFIPNPHQIKMVRRQFEALRPKRILRPRQMDGTELDLDAVIASRVDLKATGETSDRIFISSRQIERDLAVAFLVDTSRSTEAAVGDTCVNDVARDALAAMASGIDMAGDRLGIWGFSSLRRDRVFLTKCKGFDDPMSQRITDNICSLRPSHYTRLGAAIRHTSAMLAKETATRKLLIVLTDGKPNDLDHYEGQHGIEDSHMAVREARRVGISLHGVIIDEDGQDWFARIFGRGGFTLLPHPQRLANALPDIYRTLTLET